MSKSSPNFEFQLIVNFTPQEDRDTTLLYLRWNKANPHPCLSVKMLTKNDLKKINPTIIKFLKQIQLHQRLRIYVVGHSDGENKKLYSDKSCKNYLEYENHEMADYFARHLHEAKVSSAVTFNMISCKYAYGILKSPAADFLKELNARQVKAVVVARTRELAFWSGIEGSEISFKKMTKYEKGPYIHKAPGSKIVFSIEKDRMVAEDAYVLGWKKCVLLGISSCADHTFLSKKRNSLNALHDKMGGQSPYEILSELKTIASTEKPFIDEHTVFGFFRKTNTHNFFSRVIQEGQAILNENSLKTVTEAIKDLPGTGLSD